MRTKSFIVPITILLAFLIARGCAQQGAPTGGPQDETPPKVLSTDPPNYSTHFNTDKITITFDEYLDMGNFTQELVVSPPMEEKPLVRMRKKSLIIDFEEELKEDVTYTFNFGEGIKDLNEQNVLMNYEYVFSTGDYLDSLSVKGRLRNAFDLTIPETPIFVMLYRSLEDSVPLTEIPYYVGRADKEGNFAVNNLREDIYKIFVLKDGNNNFLYDLPAEKIAFLDTSLRVDGAYFRKLLLESGTYDSSDLQPDTLRLDVDTTGMSSDSITMLLDSLESLKPDFNALYVDMFMFEEKSLNQFISEYDREAREKLTMVFNIPLTDSFSYSPIIPEFLGMKDLVPEFGLARDSLTIWLGDTVVAAQDTIGIQLQYTVYDSLSQPQLKNDTLIFVFRDPSSKNSKDAKENEPEALNVSMVRNRGKHHIQKDLTFTIPQPLKTIDPSKFELFIIPDTIEVPVSFTPVQDTAHIRKARISHEWKEEAKYKIVLYPGAIQNIYGVTNDTSISTFQIRPLAEYGQINLTIENVQDTLLIQLFAKNKMVRESTAHGPGTYSFGFLEPATYRIKFIHDRNNNGDWDTGKYIEGRQPEKVEFLTRDMKVRANWDHNATYVMGSNIEPPAEAENISTEGGKEDPLF